jgi:hypothetical protein
MGLRKTDSNRLLFAFHLFPASTPQRSLLPLAHGLPTFFDAALEYFLAAMTSPHENHCIYNDLSAVQFRDL